MNLSLFCLLVFHGFSIFHVFPDLKVFMYQSYVWRDFFTKQPGDQVNIENNPRAGDFGDPAGNLFGLFGTPQN